MPAHNILEYCMADVGCVNYSSKICTMKRFAIITVLSFIFLSVNGKSPIKVEVLERNKVVQKIQPFSNVSWCYYTFETLEKDYEVMYANHETIQLDSLPPYGFINKGHQTFMHEFICYLHGSEKQFIYTPEGFSDFLGTIDNIEEAMLYLESQELEYIFYTYNVKTKSLYLVYNETPKYFILHAKFVPWIKQNTSIDDENEFITEKEKKDFKIELNKKTKEIKIIE